MNIIKNTRIPITPRLSIEIPKAVKTTIIINEISIEMIQKREKSNKFFNVKAEHIMQFHPERR